MKGLYIFLIALAFSWVHICGQEVSRKVITSAGGYYENTTASVSWTMGEVTVGTYTSSVTTLTQGFQQPHYEVIDATKDAKIDLEISIYPVPATDHITVDLNSSENDMGLCFTT